MFVLYLLHIFAPEMNTWLKKTDRKKLGMYVIITLYQKFKVVNWSYY